MFKIIYLNIYIYTTFKPLLFDYALPTMVLSALLPYANFVTILFQIVFSIYIYIYIYYVLHVHCIWTIFETIVEVRSNLPTSPIGSVSIKCCNILNILATVCGNTNLHCD